MALRRASQRQIRDGRRGTRLRPRARTRLGLHDGARLGLHDGARLGLHDGTRLGLHDGARLGLRARTRFGARARARLGPNPRTRLRLLGSGPRCLGLDTPGGNLGARDPRALRAGRLMRSGGVVRGPLGHVMDVMHWVRLGHRVHMMMGRRHAPAGARRRHGAGRSERQSQQAENREAHLSFLIREPALNPSATPYSGVPSPRMCFGAVWWPFRTRCLR
jgi:hypothetical protein